MKDFTRTLADDIGENVQATPMSHRKNDLIETFFCSPFNGQLQQRNQTLAAFQRKALRADEFLANEFFKDNRVGQAGQDAELLLSAELETVFRTFHALL